MNKDDGHPLAGVPNAEKLPEPELVNYTANKEAGALAAIFGDYVVGAWFSKNRALREAALSKMNVDINAGAHDALLTLNMVEGINILDVMRGCCNVIKRAFADKMTNVFLLSMNLAQTLCTKVILAGEEPGDDYTLGFYLKKQETQPLLDSYIPQLVEKLGDANTRVTQAAGDVILSFALCPNVGASFAAQYLLRPLRTRPGVKYPSRVYINRIKLLTILTEEIGVNVHPQSHAADGAGIQVEPLMALSMDWFLNPNHEVRQGIVELVGVVASKVMHHFTITITRNAKNK